MELSSMTAMQLRELRGQVDAAIAERGKQEQAAARERILKIAQDAGLPLKSLLNGSLKFKPEGKAQVAVRYQHPDNAAFKWTGRGRQPLWVKQWLGENKSIDDLRV